MPSETIANVRAIVQRHPHIRHAIVFGSLARGTARMDSDLDVAIAAEMPLTSEQKIALIDNLAGATGRPVDLIDLRTAGVALTDEILRSGTRVLGSDSDYAAMLSRHLVDKADFLPGIERLLEARRHAWID